ncbi:MAG TPA: porin [Allosphingosinicella sp.]|jgi:hypothetical protein|uniref:porin n=1 Tax=Allosphingosinicella sp. TaxID=2823234 RepID=UPI002F2896DC
MAALGGASLAALALVLAPAVAASTQNQAKKKARSARSLSIGSFTPAVADPRLAAEFARRGLQPSSFRFTPSSASPEKSKAVRVAVRARTITPAAVTAQATRVADSTPVSAITPTAYNLGVSVGWKGFALSGDVARVQGGPIPGGREAAEVGISYQTKKFTGRVSAGAERSDGTLPRIVPVESSYSLDVGGSYSITRNLAVTGGVRYKIDRDRLEPIADQRRDSQAVYLGTAFRF